MSTHCPQCHDGKLIIRTSKQLGPETIEQRRLCRCCRYEDVALQRPAKVFSIRVVGTTTDQSTTSKSAGE